MSLIHVTAENFETVVMQAQGKVLLDFWAAWCGPCQMIAPYIEEVAQERADILVGKVEVDRDPGLTAQFGITTIPMLVVMENGQVLSKTPGYRPKAAILKLLED